MEKKLSRGDNEAYVKVLADFTNIRDQLLDFKDYVIVDFSIARGLDYYTGIVYECFIEGLESYGSICSGGRYDNLANKFSKTHFSGVGLSIGVSRLLFILFQENLVDLSAYHNVD